MNNVKVKDRLDGASSFNFLKSRVLIILEGNDLLKFVNEKVPEPEEETKKTKWKKSDAKARRIMIYSVKDHLIS